MYGSYSFLKISVIALLLFVPLTACSEGANNTTTTEDSQSTKTEVEVADQYEREPLKIVTQDGREIMFDVEVAATPQEAAKGLMFRQQMAQNHGMIFLFPAARPLSFWMKNTYIPLDIIFIDAQGKILNIERGVPLNEQNVFSIAPAKGALELNQGTAEKMGIRPGDKVIFSGLM